MSPGPAGSVLFEGVSKVFRTGRHHGSLRDLLGSWTSGANRATAEGTSEGEFWALHDVSLRVAPGEALGIVGPNGAGKSTILKLLTGILSPTTGRVQVTGRVGALIELAAGFHPDLTGRENVYLQGAIMGMRRADVTRRFDAIVAFAGVAPFIDTPVKRYSSGMNARLGFAIAAHLDPDVLLIDEVLSVGDRAFQRRAIAHVRETIDRGVPVVLVTHQLDLVSALCGRAVLLAGGRVVRDGTAAECVSEYVRLGDEPLGLPDASIPARIQDVTVEPGDRVASGAAVVVRVRGEVTSTLAPTQAGIALSVRALPSDEQLFFTNSARAGVTLPAHGAFEMEFGLRLHLGAGFYRLQTTVLDLGQMVGWSRGPSAMITVEPSELFGGRVFLQPSVRLVEPRE